jgi:phosphopantothenate---cysteine ligase (CTP)
VAALLPLYNPAMRFLITAGNTREMIDSVRDWGNIFTGNTGYAIARALAAVAEVDLLTSNPGHLVESAGAGLAHPIRASAFTSHDDLKAALAALVTRQSYDAVFMTAAVADYRPAGVYAVLGRQADPADPAAERWLVRNVQAGKISSAHPRIAVLGEPTEKLVDLFRSEWGYRGILVKFKLEVAVGVDRLLEIGENSRLASGADFLVANTLDMVDGPKAGAYLLQPGGHQFIPRAHLPERLVSIVVTATERGAAGNS